MAAAGEVGIDLEHVTADDAAGWVHEHVVGRRRDLQGRGVAGRAAGGVAVEGDGAFAIAAVIEVQLTKPAHGPCARGVRQTAM
jgi:hypothetical protein